jgi:hypothetical protein
MLLDFGASVAEIRIISHTLRWRLQVFLGDWNVHETLASRCSAEIHPKSGPTLWVLGFGLMDHVFRAVTKPIVSLICGLTHMLSLFRDGRDVHDPILAYRVSLILPLFVGHALCNAIKCVGEV